ncbi:Uncharacterised protein [uncultured archaeon]|nr:Uncharacterised protein [uncultured archaeon]
MVYKIPDPRSKAFAELVQDVQNGFVPGTELAKHKAHMHCLWDFDASLTISTVDQPAQVTGQKSTLAKQSVPLTTKENPSVHDSDVFFNITYYSGLGAMSVSADLFSLFVPRSVANNFSFDSTHNVELSKSLYLCDKLAESIVYNSLPRSYGHMQDIIKAVSADIAKQLEDGDWQAIAEYSSPTGTSGALAFCRDKIIEHVSERTDLTAEQKKRITNSVTNLTDPAQCPILVRTWSDKCIEPAPGSLASGPTDAATQKRRDAVDDEAMKSNVGVSIKESGVADKLGLTTSEQKDLNQVCAVYYNAEYWKSGQGLSILLDEVRAHAKTVQGAFLSSNSDPRYRTLPLNDYLTNLKSAAGEYGRGSSYLSSIQTSLGELSSIGDGLQALMQQVEQRARQSKPTGALSDADINAAFEDLYQSDSSFRASLESLHTRHTALTTKYAVSRLYGPGGDKYGKTDKKGNVMTPSRVAGGIFSDKTALPEEQVAGYMALDYAMNYIGRGLDVTIAGNRLLRKIDYLVDKKDAYVEMNVSGDPNKGRAHVMLQVRMDKKGSMVEEDPAQTKQDITDALSPVLKARGARIDPAGISFSENGQYRIYSVPILRDFDLHSDSDVHALSILIELPASLYGTSSARNPALELTATVSDYTLPNIRVTKPVPGYFSFELEGGLSLTPIIGNRKQLGKGADYDNASQVDNELGHRDTSTGGVMDAFSMASYSPLTDWLNARRRTYLSDFNKTPYEWAGSGIFNTDLAAFNTSANLGQDFAPYLKASKSLFDSKVDGYVKTGLGDPISNSYAQYDPKMKGVPLDFATSLKKIEEWSPLDSKLTYWSAYKGWIMQSQWYADPKLYPDIADGLKKERDYASARIISTPFNELAPSYIQGVRAQGDLYEQYAAFNQAAREQGLSAIMGFNLFGRDNRLRVTVSSGLGPTDEQYFTQVITSKSASMNAKITNGTMLLLDHYFNVYKYQSDDQNTLARLDVHTQLNLFLISGYRHYDYDAEAELAWSNPNAGKPGQSKGVFDVFYEHHDYPDQIVLSDLNAAAKRLQDKLRPEDTRGYSLCQRILDLTDPMMKKPDDWADQISKIILGTGNDQNPGLKDLMSSKMYLGGDWSNTGVEEGMYVNGLDTYIGRDKLPIAGPIPTALIGLNYHLTQGQSSLFGLLPALGVEPKKADILLDVSGELYMPTAVVTGISSLFMDKNGVAMQVADQAPQVFENWLPPAIFSADASRLFDFGSRYALQTGLHLGGNVTGLVLNDVGLYVKNYLKVPELATTVYLNATGRFNGTEMGQLMPAYEVDAGTFTRLGNFQLGTVLYQLGRSYPYGSTHSWGFNLQFNYFFGDTPSRVSEPARVNWSEWERTNDKLYGKPAAKAPEGE